MSDLDDDFTPPQRRKPPAKPKPSASPPGGAAAPKKTGGKIPTGANTWRPAASPRPPTREKDEPRPETGGPTFFERLLFGKVGTAHLAKFCRQFAAYMEAGVDLLKALNSLERQFASTALGPVIARVGQAVRRGEALGDAAAQEPQAFDALFVSMLRVAEARGGIPEVLRSLADHYEARLRLIRQARSAMIYPIAVILVATAVGALLTIKVLPALVGILEDMVRGKPFELPLPTRLLMSFSHFVQRMGWWAIPLVLFGALFGLIWLYRRPAGKAMLDEISLSIPVLGTLRRKVDTTRFARTLSTLLDAGVDLGTSLDLTADVLHLTPLRRVVRRSREAVMEGAELSEAIESSRRFPPDVVAIVRSGEETGRLPETLAKMADDYEEQVELMVKNLGHLIQPLIVIVLGGIVFFIALAFVMAYVSILGSLAGG